MIRAKFKCEEVNKKIYSTEFVLNPVTTGSPENEDFFRTTPGGKISLLIRTQETPARFELGKFYFVDFTEINQ